MKKILLILTLLLFSVTALADLSFDTGTFTAEWTEATTNEDGSPLTDLLHTTLYYQINSEPQVFIVDVPASTPNGGGSMSYQFTVDIPLGATWDIKTIATHSDMSGNVSGEAISSTIGIDKLPPSSPIF